MDNIQDKIQEEVNQVAGWKESMNDLKKIIGMIDEDIHLRNNPSMQKPIQQQPSIQPQQQQQPVKTQMPENNPTENIEPEVSEKAIKILNTIRKMALDGIRELADNPTSELYIMLKKVWDMIDKAQNPKENKQPSA